MEGRGPYRIYDPGGSAPPGEASAAFERLVEENSRLKEKMQGIKMLGELLGESQVEASRLRQKAEELVKDSELLSPPSSSLSSFDQLAELPGKDTAVPAPAAKPAPAGVQPEPVPKPPSSATSSEFEVVPTEEQASPPESSGPPGNTPAPGTPPRGHSDLRLHLQRLGSSLSECAEEPDRSQLFTHLGRMALEFNRLASKVHKNEQRTSVLQTLCEQLREENEALKAKLDKGLEQRDQAAERLREENVELKKLLTGSGGEGPSGQPGAARQQQATVTAVKAPERGSVGAAEKKVKLLEQQRSELLEVNKQWDQHFRSMKQQYEQKITELRQKLAELQKQVTELEAERELRQRDFDRKLLLAKSKIEMEETDKEQLTVEAKELRQKIRYLQDQLSPLARQREYQDREIQRLNKALEEALSIQAPQPSPPTAFGSPEGAGSLRKQELLTQNELLKQQVKIFEEDFQRERSDRERMNEEKEDLRKQVEKLQAQLSLSSAQLKAFKDEEKAQEALRQQRRKSKAAADRYHGEPRLEHLCGAYPYPPVAAMAPPHGFDDWSQIRYPPPPMAVEHLPPLPGSHLFHLPEYAWRTPYVGPRHPASPLPDQPVARPVEPESTKNDREGPQ
ncbi:TNFAIP3-interacting protein 1 isoform X2 [Talpa occidentalis]|uniref:TNFAIP3-interacting protein 1 isoform X2 n=1 Tax=Talpa occidentalis TaxID=50954 RepID=UPI00188F926F|nr:TNFAIP3-interacting protein 1 isoform X2 [Talpa occidentalis]